MQNYITCISKRKQSKTKDELLKPIVFESLNTVLWIDKYDYVNIETCTKLNPENYNLMIMQHNIRSLLPNQTELRELMQTLKLKDSRVDIGLLCGTFLSDKTKGFANIPGYTLVERHYVSSKGGGVSILLKDGISLQRRQDLDVF